MLTSLSQKLAVGAAAAVLSYALYVGGGSWWQHSLEAPATFAAPTASVQAPGLSRDLAV